MVSSEEQGREIVAADLEVRRHVGENTAKSSEAEGVVARNRDVVFAWLRCGQTHVASGLTCDGVANAAEAACQLIARYIARQPQTVITSSRVK